MKTKVKVVAGIVIMQICLLLTMIPGKVTVHAMSDMAYICGTTNVYEEADVSSRVLMEMSYYQTVVILEEGSDFDKIKYQDTVGYVKKAMLSYLSPTEEIIDEDTTQQNSGNEEQLNGVNALDWNSDVNMSETFYQDIVTEQERLQKEERQSLIFKVIVIVLIVAIIAIGVISGLKTSKKEKESNETDKTEKETKKMSFEK